MRWILGYALPLCRGSVPSGTGNTIPAKRECRCTEPQIPRYRNKVSGPLLDRTGFHTEVPGIHYQERTSLQKGEPSAAIRDRVVAARQVQSQRVERRRLRRASPSNWLCGRVL